MQAKTFLILLTCLLPALCFAQEKDSLAEKMLIYQLSNGGWPKQLENKSVVNYSLPLTESLMELIKQTTAAHATIDNKATSREINQLVSAYKKTGNTDYLKAAEKGIAYLLSAQHPNGGWPQYYPDQSSYRSQVTYNDNAMINVLNIMQDIVTGNNDFDVVSPSDIPKAKKAVKNGLACILKTQVTQNGHLTIWAAQYDKNTLLPAKARAFEPASLSAGESTGIVYFLMRFKKPSKAIQTSVIAAVQWFEENKMEGLRFAKTVDAANKKTMALIPDSATVTWARFYDLKSNNPIFGDRDHSIKLKLEEVSEERRNGYAWYGNFAQKLIEKEYPKWLKVNGIKKL
ncbi:pectate lyase [Pedobacter sp. AW31-3R]|uniref:pectate lyase n=1 Tax=Pedobacter sp. AW31-3R TaxID=3445781 RepID=UPI003FA08901